MTDAELSRSLFSLVLLLAAAHAAGHAFSLMRMPRVIGEIAGGLLLGPSALAFFLPDVHRWLFHGFPAQENLVSGFYWLGLVMLMFVSGFNIQKKISSDERRLVAGLLAAATLLPFAAGLAYPFLFERFAHMGAGGNRVSFALVLAIAFAVTSIPVISKIFLDLGIMGTRFAKLVLAISTVQDLILWCALAVATGLAGAGEIRVGGIAAEVATSLLLILAGLLAGPPLFRAVERARFNLVAKSSRIGFALTVCFLVAAASSFLGVNIVFGAMIAGVIVGGLPEETFRPVKEKIAEMSMSFFVPIYFAIVGLKIDLPGSFDLALFAEFLLVSSLMAMGCVLVAARLLGLGRRAATNFAMAMNTRGGPGIVVASIAHGFQIIDDKLFVALVLAAILTSLVSGFWFRLQVERGEDLMEEGPAGGSRAG